MKHYLSLIYLLVLSFLTGCAHFSSQQEQRNITGFSALHVGGLADVFISQADTEQIRVKVSGMPIEDVITQVRQNTLYITTKGHHSGESVKVYVSYKSLKQIKTSGSATISGETPLISDEITLITSDSGDIKHLTIKANTLDVQINDSGNADLEVEVHNSVIEMNDAGDLTIRGVASHQQLRSNASRGTLDNANLTISNN